MALKRKTPGINGSSSADIAFMLLIFFLITTSMDTDKGLKRRLPPMAPKQQKQQEIEINDRNIMRLLVNRADEIVISRKDASGIDQLIPVKLDELKDYAVEFITNPENKPFLPELERREIEGLGERTVITSGYAATSSTSMSRTNSSRPTMRSGMPSLRRSSVARRLRRFPLPRRSLSRMHIPCISLKWLSLTLQRSKRHG